jgi:hypothetical protein
MHTLAVRVRAGSVPDGNDQILLAGDSTQGKRNRNSIAGGHIGHHDALS